MKKLSLLAILLVFLAGCNNTTPEPDQTKQSLICTLTAPEANTEIDLADGSFEIAGNAMVNVGEISSVTLKVVTDVINEITSVPFTYTYTFSEGQEAGSLTVTLTVTGDKGAEGQDQVTVTLVKEEEPVVLPQEITATLTAPADGSEWVSDAPLAISGAAVLSKGEVQSVVLTVGDEVISEVTSVPFTYDYTAPEGLAEGDLHITLEVIGNEGGKASAKAKVIHKRPAEPTPPPTPDYETMTDSRDGKSYRIVTLGSQVWMAENLAWLPEVYPSAAAADSGTEMRYFVLNYEGSDVAEAKAKEEYTEYGVLYNWFAANGCTDKTGFDATAVPSGVRGACPEGWHMPSKAEWQIMEAWVADQLEPVTGLNSSYETDHNMKNVWAALAGVEVGWSASEMVEENPDLEYGPRDLFGFCVKPAGKCWQSGSFGMSGNDTGFWATDMQTYGGGCVEFRNSQYGIAYTKSGYNERRGYSVRCVKD